MGCVREIQFNLKNSPLSYNLKMKRKYQPQKQRNNSQIFFPKEDNKIKEEVILIL